MRASSAPFRIGAAWMCFVPVRAHQIESSTLVLPCPFLPVICTTLPSGVISTAVSRFTFSAMRLMIFMCETLSVQG
jgi:hypothetical protein